MKKRKNKKEDPSLKYVIAAARKVWRWSAERRSVLAAAKIGKGWQCAICAAVGFVAEKTLKNGKKRKQMPVQIDHIDPIGPEPTTWKECGEWLHRLFCPVSNLQCVCRACHQIKTNKEREERTVTSADLDEWARRVPKDTIINGEEK